MRMEKAGLDGAVRPVVPVCRRTRTAKPRVQVAGAQAAGLTTAALTVLVRLPASAPAGAYSARTLRPVATARMPMHATIIRGRRHLRVALEIKNKSPCGAVGRAPNPWLLGPGFDSHWEQNFGSAVVRQKPNRPMISCAKRGGVEGEFSYPQEGAQYRPHPGG